MRILHTSDWHLGRQFHNLSLLDDQRLILQQLVAAIQTEAVDVVLVCGDIYDRSVPPAAAVALLGEIVETVCNELKVPMILIAGNHDSPERLGFAAGALAAANLHIRGPLDPQLTPVILSDPDGDIAFYPLPYVDPATVRSLYGVAAADHDAAWAFLCDEIRRRNDPPARRVLLSHCYVAGGSASESERPLAIGGSEAVSLEHFRDFHYVALGHLHGRQSFADGRVRYSGSPLKYSFGEELQKKSLTIVDLDGAGGVTIRDVPLPAERDVRILEGSLDAILAAGVSDPRRDDYLLVRLSDTQALLDPIGRLRDVYPNVLHLERPGLLGSGTAPLAQRERLSRGELAMVEDFYSQVSGESLSVEQRDLVGRALERLHREA